MTRDEPKKTRLVLFFTENVSLEQWERSGLLDREVAIYQHLQKSGFQVTFFTYGRRPDLAFADRLDGIQVLCNRWNLPSSIYKKLMFWLHRRELRQCDIIKTNQISGANWALAAASRWQKPLIARFGFMHSDFVRQQRGTKSTAYQRAQELEHRVFSQANLIVVTTASMAKDVVGRTPEASHRVKLIPNYVDTETFQSLPHRQTHADLLFVGRLETQKNLESLLEAIRPLETRLIVIGGGKATENWQRRYADLNNQVKWLDNVPHNRLPELMAHAKVFILPSLYEGHPKVLIEAMACGMPIIGANTPGIREMIQHQDNGFLCGTDVKSIRKAIITVLGDHKLRQRIGNNARKHAVTKFSLNHIIAPLELTTLKELIATTTPHQRAA